MSDQIRTFMGYLWVQKEDNIYTIGINEEGLEEITEINSVDLPAENEKVDADAMIGSIETDDGPLDIYTPVSGTIVEINSAVVDEPDSIQEDPYDNWLVKIESDDEMEEEEDEDSEEDDEDDDEEEEEDWEDEK